MEESDLRAALEAAFGGTPAERRVVARAASDLAASGQYVDDTGAALTVDRILAELADSPDERPADRWNWWMGALEVAYGGYEQFQVRAWRDTGEDP